ncbi:MAG TPA: hypothetical protein VIW45_13325, partial [Vicinamibacterales bacterium]
MAVRRFADDGDFRIVFEQLPDAVTQQRVRVNHGNPYRGGHSVRGRHNIIQRRADRQDNRNAELAGAALLFAARP